MSRRDRLIGIVLGLVIGVVAVILFVFGGGANSVDAPSIDRSGGGVELNAPDDGQNATAPSQDGEER